MLEMTTERLQKNLKYLNYYFGKIDGIKGKQTIQAIKEYQANNGLVVDGIAGQKTIESIRSLICRIQEILEVEQDGVAGNITTEATKTWQRNHSLSGDGICGVKTRQSMFNQRPVSNEWNFEHFKKSEFRCKCGCGFDNISTNLVSILEDIRAYFGGKPLIITSGCRCSKHNSNVGGVAGSRHVSGKAVDMYISGVNTKTLLNYCQVLVNQGRLRYTYTNSSNMNGVVHIDIY